MLSFCEVSRSSAAARELVRRAILTIRNQRQRFEATAKPNYGGGIDDVFTSADTKAQAAYVKSLRNALRTSRRCRPGYRHTRRQSATNPTVSAPGRRPRATPEVS
jgi:hypothetical protein